VRVLYRGCYDVGILNARLSGSQIEIDDLFLSKYLQDSEGFEGVIKKNIFGTIPAQRWH
jgi:hypothetical protein